jgi:hypothetical protein
MEQFEETPYEGEEQDTTTSRDLSDAPLLKSPTEPHPPRRSSLEPLRSPTGENHQRSYLDDLAQLSEKPSNDTTSKASSVRSFKYASSAQFGVPEPRSPGSPLSAATLNKSLPPPPDREPDLPFDFHRFLDQLRHRTADPVAKFLRSFLIEFGKKQWMVHEQVKIINDFLTFISGKMAQCEVWREVSDAEFDNAKEGMEKLVMNRLYSQTFSPAIPPPAPLPTTKGKRKAADKALGPGRRGQHQEDIERDDVLAQKVKIYGWVREQHLDIPPVGDSGQRFLKLAQQELLKIKTYRAPRDKVICVLNCCKVIFGLLRNSKSSDTSADSFVPLLIYVVLQANPEHLVSNIQYILRFRNQDKLGGEAGYYLSSLSGAIQFIENLDRTALTVSDVEFEKNVEAAVSAIAEGHRAEEARLAKLQLQPQQSSYNEKTGKPEPSPSYSTDSELSPRRSTEGTQDSAENSSDEKAAVSGLLRTFQKPLSSIGRIFSDESSSSSNTLKVQHASSMPTTPRRLSPAVFSPPPRNSDEQPRRSEDTRRPGMGALPGSPPRNQPAYAAEDAAARQASAEAAEAQRIMRAEHKDVVEYVI